MDERKQGLTLEEFVEEYNSALKEADKYNYLVRASELQLEQCQKLEILKNKIKSFKYQSIKIENEYYANFLFHCQCVVNSMISILKMWMLLKERKYDSAWSKLVDAQDYISIALRASESHFGLKEYVERLYNIENVVFPGWPYYNSSAIVEKAGKCSICQHEFNSCDHIEGYIYMGRLCRRIEREPVHIDHVALVNQPKDKRCIIKYISTDDRHKRDYITWRVLDEKFPNDTKNTLLIEGVVLNLSDLDFD